MGADVFMSTVAESGPVPKGRPSKALFIVGAIGCIINTIVAIWFLMATYVLITQYQYPLRHSDFSFFSIGNFLLGIGLILASVGYLGTRLNYGSAAGVAGFAFSILVSALLGLWFVRDTLETLATYIWDISGVYFNFLGVIYPLFFATLILWGATHIIIRRLTGTWGLSIATGIMLILTAVLLLLWINIWINPSSYYEYGGSGYLIRRAFSLVWAPLFFISQILNTTLFFMAKVPESPAT